MEFSKCSISQNRLVPKLAPLPQGGHKKMCKTFAHHCSSPPYLLQLVAYFDRLGQWIYGSSELFELGVLREEKNDDDDPHSQKEKLKLCMFSTYIEIFRLCTFLSPASQSEEGGLLNSPPSVRPSVRPSVHFVSKITQKVSVGFWPNYIFKCNPYDHWSSSPRRQWRSPYFDVMGPSERGDHLGQPKTI